MTNTDSNTSSDFTEVIKNGPIFIKHHGHLYNIEKALKSYFHMLCWNNDEAL
jgi:hypothetical protein